jgi:N-acetylneuraminate lyase/4-hydroxy-tetrahydrodipicolinate synthase
LGRHAAVTGADCIGAIPPYYHHHDERAVLEHFRRLVEAVDLPVYIYNNPKTSGFTLTSAFLRKLADVGVAGIKDSSFSYIDFTHFVLAMEDRPKFRLLVGSEALALPCWMAGAVGSVCGLANVFPELTVSLWDAFQKKEYEKAAQLQLRVNRGRQILHIPSSTNAACYYALHARGVDAGYPKAPILPVEKEKGEQMVAAFRAMGLLEPAPAYRRTA